MFGVQRIGRYEVLNHLASGGMGQVYLARATGLGGFERQVVVKTLDLSITEDGDAFVTMFLDEARLVGALHHQYIAPVYEVGCDDEGRYYLVMDYVHGETAEAVLRVCTERMVRMPLAFSLTVVSCVASALDYAHGLCAADGTPLDIVHRDVSLSNVMCGHDGSVKLIDFGIAKASNRATKTQVGTLKGKIGYLAPEQIHRQAVDHRADIFALGIVLYELTTGTRAFRESSDLMTLERITKGDIRRPSEVVADYPPELERIVMKALEVHPSRRFQDAATLGRELEAFARRRDIPLGHGAIADVMAKLFSDHRGRRRIARGSSEVKTDPSIAALSTVQDEKTPVTDLVETDTRTVTVDERFSVKLRAQRPTLPMKEGARSQRPTTPTPGRKRAAMLPLEDRPTPIGDPAAQLRARNALIPLEDRPTPIAESAMMTPPALPAPPPGPALGHPLGARRIPTGPQLPIDALGSDTDVDDAPTVIAAELPERLDSTGDPTDAPTDVKPTIPRPSSGLAAATKPVQTAFASPPPPPAIYLREKNLATAVVARMKQLRVVQPTAAQSWVLLCGMFAIAVAVACIVAML